MTVLGVPDRPGAALTIFSKVAAKNIAMDMIVQNVAADGQADISFTVAPRRAARHAQGRRGGRQGTRRRRATTTTRTCRRFRWSAWAWPRSRRGRRMFRALAEKGINIQMITTSEIKISVLVDRDSAQEALRTVHEAFELDKAPAGAGAAGAGGRRATAPTTRPTLVARHASAWKN